MIGLEDPSYIKIYRNLLDWQWYGNLNTKVLFLHLLLKANWKEKQWQGQTIERGQLISSFSKLGEETGLTIREVRTAVKNLVSTGEVTSKGQSKYTVFTVVRYDWYQRNDKETTSERQASDKQTTNKRHSNDILTTTTKEREERKEREEGKDKKEKDVCAEPTEFFLQLELNDHSLFAVTGDYLHLLQELYPMVDVEQEFRKMKGWIDSNPTKRKTAKGIKRFITGWLSKEQDKGHSGYASTGAYPLAKNLTTGQYAQNLERWAEGE